MRKRKPIVTVGRRGGLITRVSTIPGKPHEYLARHAILEISGRPKSKVRAIWQGAKRADANDIWEKLRTPMPAAMREAIERSYEVDPEGPVLEALPAPPKGWPGRQEDYKKVVRDLSRLALSEDREYAFVVGADNTYQARIGYSDHVHIPRDAKYIIHTHPGKALDYFFLSNSDIEVAKVHQCIEAIHVYPKTKGVVGLRYDFSKDLRNEAATYRAKFFQGVDAFHFAQLGWTSDAVRAVRDIIDFVLRSSAFTLIGGDNLIKNVVAWLQDMGKDGKKIMQQALEIPDFYNDPERGTVIAPPIRALEFDAKGNPRIITKDKRLAARLRENGFTVELRKGEVYQKDRLPKIPGPEIWDKIKKPAKLQEDLYLAYSAGGALTPSFATPPEGWPGTKEEYEIFSRDFSRLALQGDYDFYVTPEGAICVERERRKENAPEKPKLHIRAGKYWLNWDKIARDINAAHEKGYVVEEHWGISDHYMVTLRYNPRLDPEKRDLEAFHNAVTTSYGLLERTAKIIDVLLSSRSISFEGSYLIEGLIEHLVSTKEAATVEEAQERLTSSLRGKKWWLKFMNGFPVIMTRDMKVLERLASFGFPVDLEKKQQ